MVKLAGDGQSRESGHVYLLALFVMLLVMTTMALVAASLGLQQRLLLRQERELHLNALVDAGLATALARLHLSRGYPGELEDFAAGTLSTEVEAIGYERFSIVVRATYGGGSRRILAEVRADGVRPPRVIRWLPGSYWARAP
jgi:hypothetical protein